MFTVQIEYEIVDEGFTESCGVFDDMIEARQFTHDTIDEIYDKIQDGVEIVYASTHIWHTSGGEIAENLEKEEDRHER